MAQRLLTATLLLLVFAVSASATLAQDAPVVRTVNAGDLGTILVDRDGMTLYVFSNDRPNALSTCADACAAAWPPAVLQTPTRGAVAGVGDTGLLTRSDGQMQLAWRGMPLYRYAQDRGPGQVNGDGIAAFGGTWSVARPDLIPPTPAAPEPSPESVPEPSAEPAPEE